jgi:hypothetical protein
MVVLTQLRARVPLPAFYPCLRASRARSAGVHTPLESLGLSTAMFGRASGDSEFVELPCSLAISPATVSIAGAGWATVATAGPGWATVAAAGSGEWPFSTQLADPRASREGRLRGQAV